jgi:RTX calcium-binding nonapeptide repeat (4 copies)
MRTVAMFVGVAALMILLFASVALAVEKQCTSQPCYGTADNDTLYERSGDGVSDTIYARAGHDVVRANAYAQDKDVLHGGGGRDRLNANDNGASDTTPEDTLDTVYGGKGYDICIVDDRSEVGGGCEEVRVDPGEA